MNNNQFGALYFINAPYNISEMLAAALRDRWKNARVYPGKILNVLILGQNYHLIHHLWPSIPWYNYQPAYYLMKPLLDEKGSPQTTGLLQKKDFLEFIYDVFIGIHWHH